MRTLDPKWTDLAAGYQSVLAFQEKLETEFGRAVQAGLKYKFRRELTEWQKKRRAFIAMIVIAPLSLIGLCLAAFYFHEVACVLAWWLMTVIVILVTLAVAGWGFIREMVNGRPVPGRETLNASVLERRWWDTLTAPNLSLAAPSEKNVVDFPTLLSRLLPHEYLTVNRGGSFLTVVGPSGVWLFEVCNWDGAIVKQDGVWTRVRSRRETLTQTDAPDDAWLARKQVIESHLPERVGTGSLVQGGLVFTHPKAALDKSRIVGNSAPYGPAKAWAERIQQSAPDEGFTLEARLSLLDALAGERPAGEGVSAKDEAARLYQSAAEELRAYVAKMVQKEPEK